VSTLVSGNSTIMPDHLAASTSSTPSRTPPPNVASYAASSPLVTGPSTPRRGPSTPAAAAVASDGEDDEDDDGDRPAVETLRSLARWVFVPPLRLSQ
jgi:hypothetical protein